MSVLAKWPTYDPQCGWRWCGADDDPWGASSSTICESDAQRGGEHRCIAIVAARLAAEAERIRWTVKHSADGSKPSVLPPVGAPWIYRQPVEPGPRVPERG